MDSGFVAVPYHHVQQDIDLLAPHIKSSESLVHFVFVFIAPNSKQIYLPDVEVIKERTALHHEVFYVP
jgi:hypothetical protein